MSGDHVADVSSAFDILLQEIAAEKDALQARGAEAFERGDTVTAREVADQVDAVLRLSARVAELQREWERLGRPATRGRSTRARTESIAEPRLAKGERTPEQAYFRPILETLVRMGGSCAVPRLLDAVGEEMKPMLKPADLQPLWSDPARPRWRNTAQWARHSMVQAGLLAADSPRGIWTITDKGRQWLSEAVHAEQGCMDRWGRKVLP